MFTGIVEDIGIVEALLKKENLYRLSLKSSVVSQGIRLGDSILVDGVCLTLCENKKALLSFDMMKETLDKTALGALKKGSKVNLERALKASGRFGGHLVTGHVDGITQITEIIRRKNYVEFRLSVSPVLKKFIVLKGSVCLNGISLTVGDVLKDSFSVHLIPFTMKITTMAVKRAGDALNIEADILARYILNSK